MYENLTVEDIKSRILERITTNLQTREGSYTNDVISAAAAEIAEVYHSMDALLPAFYLDETSGTYIDRQAAVVGITRKAGTKAACSITFTGSNGAQVPDGTPFYTTAGLAFTLRETVTVADGTAAGTLEAAEVGDLYNIGAGEITQTLKNYSGITGYTNGEASSGTDPESDASLLSRYLDRMRRTATSGNPYHYQQWANSVAGVGASRVIAKWDGPGTVKVILADPNMEPAAEETVEACAAYIEEQRPVGAAVTVVAAESLELSVSATVTIDGTTTKEAVQTAFAEALGTYFRSLVTTAFAQNLDGQLDTLAEETYTVSYNRISAILLTIPGVVDHTALLVGGGTQNVSVAADAVPVLTEVTVA